MNGRSFLIALSTCWILAGCNGDSDRDRESSSYQPAVNESAPESVPEEVSPRTAEAYVDQIAVALQAEEYEVARTLFREALEHYPDDSRLLFMAARVEYAAGERGRAIERLAEIPITDPQLGLAAQGQAAEWLLEEGELLAAEEKLLHVLAAAPDALVAHRLLARIYNTQARRWEAFEHLQRLIAAGDFSEAEVFRTVNLREPFPDEELKSRWLANQADDPYREFVPLREVLEQKRFGAVVGELEELNERHPGLLEPWIWHGAALVWLERFDALPEWHARAPEGFLQHPEYWYVRGRWHAATGESERAARAFARVITLDPRHLAAHQALAAQLLQLGQAELAAEVRGRIEALAEIHDHARQYITGHGGEGSLQRIVDAYGRLGDDFGLFAWSMLLAFQRQGQPDEETLQLRSRLAARWQVAPPELLKQLPVDEWPELNALPKVADRVAAGSGATPTLKFHDVAAALGIDAEYDFGGSLDEGLMTYQSLGSGVAAFDFDNDGWVDFYFSNAGASPRAETGFASKRLYRSHAAKRFTESAEQANLVDFGFGQGVATGDFNQDGFCDLLVANIGALNLYQNQGDGTFKQVELPQPAAEDDWNSCVTIADLNGDALPDIVRGAYIRGPEVYQRECRKPGIVARNCNPKSFPPAQTDILFSDGAGGWQRSDDLLNEALSGGFSLGALVANIDGQAGNDLFVANDLTSNFLLLSNADGQLDFDSATLAGVAVDGEGRAQACMGIGYGDLDRNGKGDLVVTNFYGEVNTVYLQTAPGVFLDGTRQTDLHASSVEMLGFGCQLADVDNDGWLDLFVLNGHIDDYRAAGQPFKMQPQLYRNREGTFHRSEAATAGPYFVSEMLGRSLQQCDYNNDGRIDFVATHLDRPAALLRNDCDAVGGVIQFRLVGTLSARDAIGAEITVLDASGGALVREVVAGDGYYGASDRLVTFGLDPGIEEVSVAVQWPSGRSEVFRSLKIGARYLLIEGNPLSGGAFSFGHL